MIMPIFIALILGAVQGLTEFLPVSSSGHLALIQNIDGIKQYTQNALTFDVILHLGTLAAVLFVFWKDFISLFRGLFGLVGHGFKIEGKSERKLVLLLLVSTVPLVIGALLEDTIESIMGSPLIIGCALCVTAVLLFFADRLGGGDRDALKTNYGHAAIIGGMQLVALVPGISRSGSTLCGGLFCGLKRDFAVTYAFLLSIPAVVGAAVLKVPKVLAEGVEPEMLAAYIVGFLASAVFGYLAIKLVQLLTKKHGLKYFSIYCAVVDIVSIILTLI